MAQKKADNDLIISTLLSINKKLEEANIIASIQSKEYLTLSETAKYLGYSEAYIYILVSKKRLPCYKPTGDDKGKLYFAKSELNDFITQKTAIPAAHL